MIKRQLATPFAVHCRPQIKTLFEDDSALQTALLVFFRAELVIKRQLATPFAVHCRPQIMTLFEDVNAL